MQLFPLKLVMEVFGVQPWLFGVQPWLFGVQPWLFEMDFKLEKSCEG